MAQAPKRKTRTSTAPENETKADKFKRLGTARVTKALKAIEQIGNLSGSGYESTQAQVDKIFKAISEASQAAYTKFANKGQKASGPSFDL